MPVTLLARGLGPASGNVCSSIPCRPPAEARAGAARAPTPAAAAFAFAIESTGTDVRCPSSGSENPRPQSSTTAQTVDQRPEESGVAQAAGALRALPDGGQQEEDEHEGASHAHPLRTPEAAVAVAGAAVEHLLGGAAEQVAAHCCGEVPPRRALDRVVVGGGGVAARRVVGSGEVSVEAGDQHVESCGDPKDASQQRAVEE